MLVLTLNSLAGWFNAVTHTIQHEQFSDVKAACIPVSLSWGSQHQQQQPIGYAKSASSQGKQLLQNMYEPHIHTHSCRMHRLQSFLMSREDRDL